MKGVEQIEHTKGQKTKKVTFDYRVLYYTFGISMDTFGCCWNDCNAFLFDTAFYVVSAEQTENT